MTILESPEKYTQEAMDVVIEIFEEKKIEGEELKALALEVNRKKIEAILLKFDPLNDELNPHESQYLDTAEIKSLYLEILKEHISRKDGFKFDVMQYAMGG